MNYFPSVLFVVLAISMMPAKVVRAQPNDAPVLPSLLPTKHLHNVIEVAPGIFSGALPEGKEAFHELHTLGIKTIINVDGIPPNVTAAKAEGMRYVHLPHGYDGVPRERVLQIAKAIRDLPQPIYIHCHHGKHRSPAATAAACITLGKLRDQEAAKVLELAGTNKGYRGLFDAALGSKPVEAKTLDELDVEFVEVSPVTSMVEAMVALDEVFDRLKKAQQSQDLIGMQDAENALLLMEHYQELARQEESRRRPSRFVELAEEGRVLADQFEQELQRHVGETRDSVGWQTHIGSIEKNCKSCHTEFRDNSR